MSTDGLKIMRQLGAIAMTGSYAVMPLGRSAPVFAVNSTLSFMDRQVHINMKTRQSHV